MAGAYEVVLSAATSTNFVNLWMGDWGSSINDAPFPEPPPQPYLCGFISVSDWSYSSEALAAYSETHPATMPWNISVWGKAASYYQRHTVCGSDGRRTVYSGSTRRRALRRCSLTPLGTTAWEVYDVTTGQVVGTCVRTAIASTVLPTVACTNAVIAGTISITGTSPATAEQLELFAVPEPGQHCCSAGWDCWPGGVQGSAEIFNSELPLLGRDLKSRPSKVLLATVYSPSLPSSDSSTFSLRGPRWIRWLGGYRP